MVKRPFCGLKVFRVDPQTGSIAEVIVETAYRAGKPYYEARLRVRAPNGALWDIFASSFSLSPRQTLTRSPRRIQKGER